MTLDGKALPPGEGLPNVHMRLFGGAQYHRAMAEFRASVGQLTCPDISREEIVNACGIDDFHDGVNYTRTSCVIAVSKARDMFEPFLHQVRRAGQAPSHRRVSLHTCTGNEASLHRSTLGYMPRASCRPGALRAFDKASLACTLSSSLYIFITLCSVTLEPWNPNPSNSSTLTLYNKKIKRE